MDIISSLFKFFALIVSVKSFGDGEKNNQTSVILMSLMDNESEGESNFNISSVTRSRTKTNQNKLNRDYSGSNLPRKRRFYPASSQKNDKIFHQDETDAGRMEKFVQNFWDNGFGFTKLWFYDRGEMIGSSKGESVNTYQEIWRNRTKSVKDTESSRDKNLDHDENSGTGDHVSRWSNHGQYQISSFNEPTQDVKTIISVHLNEDQIPFDPVKNLTSAFSNEPNFGASEIKGKVENFSSPIPIHTINHHNRTNFVLINISNSSAKI